MNTKLNNFFAYFECLYMNIVTRIIVILFCLGIFSEICIDYHFGLILCGFAFTFFYIFRYGRTSYEAYKRGFEHMYTYKHIPPKNSAYCIYIGYKVAERRFRNKYPKEYDALLTPRPVTHTFEVIFIRIDNNQGS